MKVLIVNSFNKEYDVFEIISEIYILKMNYYINLFISNFADISSRSIYIYIYIYIYSNTVVLE